MGILRDIGLWFWRLFPANPILVRVVSTGGKRSRHFYARLVYLVALVVVFMLWGGFIRESSSLAQLAKQSTQTFMAVSAVQLLLMSFIAPVFCAAAITQEKDANTYHILLTTPLSNGQIVLGSLFSRLYFVWVLLLAGLPIFCITMIYGGVTTAEVFESFGLAACTGLVTGSIAIMISFLKVGTRRTIFSFFVGIAVYLLAVGIIGLSGWGQFSGAAPGTLFDSNKVVRMSWLAPVHPFLSLLAVTGKTPAPAYDDVRDYGWPGAWLLAYPQFGYMAITTAASAVMILLSLFYVRRGARDSEGALAARLRQFVSRGGDGERRRRPRRVWRNPVAWREANTRGAAGGRSLLRLVFLIGGILAAVVVLIAHEQGWWGLSRKSPALTRSVLIAMTWIELAVILLTVTSTAASTLTREKESQTMELLLSTPLTSLYIIAGMLQGLVRFVLPLIIVPTVTVILFSAADLFRPAGVEPVVAWEAMLVLPVQLVAFAALAAMIGLQFSLISRKTVTAVMYSTVVVLAAAGLLWGCGLVLSDTPRTVGAVFLPFFPFPSMQVLLDPWGATTRANQYSGWGTQQLTVAELIAFRMTRAIFAGLAAVAYGVFTYAIYKSMVRGFDMTVRRQSA